MDVPHLPDRLPYLPPEMYEEIFSNLSSEDFLSVINANPDWDDLLWDLKTTALFALVLNVLIKERRYLSPTVLLTCRLVHSSWKSAVDSVMARDPLSYFPRPFEFDINRARLEAFINHSLRFQRGNPFIGRYLLCSLDSKGIESVMDRFGASLETLCLFEHFHETSIQADSIRRLSGFLVSTPNVRDLRVSLDIGLRDGPELQRLPQLPPLTHLSKLDLSGCLMGVPSSESDVYAPILETMFLQACGGTLTELIISSRLFLVSGVQDLLPKLRKLSFEYSRLSNQQLEILSRFNSRELDSLVLSHHSQDFTPELVSVLTSFPLKSLKMQMPRIDEQRKFEAVTGLNELLLWSNRWSNDDVLKAAPELVPFLSRTFPDLELLIMPTRFIKASHMSRENQQPLFDGLRKLKEIRYLNFLRKFVFTR